MESDQNTKTHKINNPAWNHICCFLQMWHFMSV